MPYVPIENLLDKVGKSVYKLVILTSKRALEIAEGQPPLVKVAPSTKPSTIALHEIVEGKLQYKKIKPEK